MGNLWLKIKVWTKVTFFSLLLIYVLIFIAKNSEQKVKPWLWFGSASVVETSVLLLMLIAFLTGGLIALLIRTTLTTARQLREMRERNRSAKEERERVDQAVKAAMLRKKTSADDLGPAA